MKLPIPVPTPDETLERFAIRTHKAMQHMIRDPEQRNQLVFRQWAKHRGPAEEEKIAARTFDPDRYVRRRNVCVFAEHSAVDGQGRPRRYDLGELCRIVRSCNHRIRDFGGFSPISDGHTPDNDEPHREDPEILGYAGPYRIGMIGRETPRWAIFCDEYHLKQCADRLARKPRRSVELWTFANDPKRTHFDPIAALGAETPRLPLPVKFSRTHRDGVLVERYTFSLPGSALPGAGNTYVKKFERGEQTTMLANEDISQLLAALAETPQFKWIDGQMAKEQSASNPAKKACKPGGMKYQDDDEEEPEVTEPIPGEDVADDDLADLNDLIVPDDEEEPAKPARFSRRNSDGVVTKYARLQKAHNTLVQEHGRMASQLAAMVKRNTDAERTASVMELAHRYPDFVDLESELDAVLYNRNASMSDAEFGQHLATVEKYAQRADMMARATRPELPRGQVDRGRSSAKNEKYEAALAAEAVRIHTEAVNAGKQGFTWEDAKAQAEKRISA